MTSLLRTHAPAFLDDSFPLPLDLPFTTAQARSAGISPSQLTRLCREGLLRRVLKGVYAAAQMQDNVESRGQALSLVCPPGSVLTDWSACWYWTGVDRPNSHLAVPELSVFRFRGRERLRNGLVRSGERWLAPSDVVELADGMLITTQIRTAWDLGRFFHPVIALGGMDALARVAVDVSELIDGVERFRRQRGVVQLRMLAPLVDGRAESVGESSLRWRWHEAPSLPPPELQIPVYDDHGVELFRLDLGVEELRYAAEYDGEQWHTEEDRPHDEGRRGRLDLDFSWTIDAFRRENVYGPRADASARLVRGVIRARNRYATPRGQRIEP